MPYIVDKLAWEQKTGLPKLRNGQIWIAGLNQDGAHRITTELGATLLSCYIDPAVLAQVAIANGRKPREFFEAETLPDRPSMKSGDFGEILCWTLVQEWRDRPVIEGYRWRSRSTKNDTVRGPDLIGYVMNETVPSPDDVLTICQVKTRSASVSPTVVRESYDDVVNDYVTRLATSLYFYQIWLRDKGNNAGADKYARFSSPHVAPYRRRLLAFVVHDTAIWQDVFLTELPDHHDQGAEVEVAVVVVCVDELAAWIEDVRQAAVMSVPE